MPAARRRKPDTPDTSDPKLPQEQEQEQGKAESAPDNAPDNQSNETNDLLRELIQSQKEHRAEVAELREEVAQARSERISAPAPSSAVLSPEELQERRQEEIAKHQFYCPACGALYDRERECSGRGEAPHPPLDVVSTKELQGDDTSKHTAAPGVRP